MTVSEYGEGGGEAEPGQESGRDHGYCLRWFLSFWAMAVMCW